MSSLVRKLPSCLYLPDDRQQMLATVVAGATGAARLGATTATAVQRTAVAVKNLLAGCRRMVRKGLSCGQKTSSPRARTVIRDSLLGLCQRKVSSRFELLGPIPVSSSLFRLVELTTSVFAAYPTVTARNCTSVSSACPVSLLETLYSALRR